MSQIPDPPDGWKEIPEEQFRDNAFAVTPSPIWPHLSMVWEDDTYRLCVYSGHPIDNDLLLTMNLVTLLVAEAEFSFDWERDGRVMPHWIAESNAVLEKKALALEAMAARLRQRHSRPQVVRRSTSGNPKEIGDSGTPADGQ